jgi:hypothetical protein
MPRESHPELCTDRRRSKSKLARGTSVACAFPVNLAASTSGWGEFLPGDQDGAPLDPQALNCSDQLLVLAQSWVRVRALPNSCLDRGHAFARGTTSAGDQGRNAVAGQSAVGVPFPHALCLRNSRVRRSRAKVGGNCHGALRRLHQDRGGGARHRESGGGRSGSAASGRRIDLLDLSSRLGVRAVLAFTAVL